MVKVLQIAKFGVDGQVIGDVISKILVGRWVNRGEPNSVYTQILDVIQRVNNASEITNAISIAVFIRARVNLVDNAIFPP